MVAREGQQYLREAPWIIFSASGVISLLVLSVPTALLAIAPNLTIFATLRVIQGLFMASAFTLVSLCAFAFGNSLAILLGWAVLLFGAAAIVIDLRSGSTTWRLTLGTLAFFGLLTAINVG